MTPPYCSTLRRGVWLKAWTVLFALLLPLSARAFIQFDVFPGYDGVISDACWFPLVCEIKNDEPSFNGTIEIADSQLNQGQKIRLQLELPTGTLKRVVIPMFAQSRGYSSWDLTLTDERGKQRAVQTGVRPRKQLASQAILLGALPRTPAGAPPIQAILPQNAELQPTSARFQVPVFPDNPLALQGMDVLYLNSEKVSELRPAQANAIRSWLLSGGHLVVAVEQTADITSARWLREIFPVDVTDTKPIREHPQIQRWLTDTWEPGKPGESTGPFSSLQSDPNFESAEISIATGRLRDGRILVESKGSPLIVTAHRGKGMLTALLFSPEREPFRSWANLPVFWARLARVPPAFYRSSDYQNWGGWGVDGVFGAMIETTQVHQLPLAWLLLLLVAYLSVIGPLDHYWLKKIGKPMLTWITFPGYVLFFSLLIYVIGYKLRAGELEWNELHVVDVTSDGIRSELHGHTFASVYSPANARYEVAGEQKYSAFRSEYSGWSGVQSYERSLVDVEGDNFRAGIYVPVWSSQLYVSDWIQTATSPIRFWVNPASDGWEVKVENRTGRKLTSAGIVVGGKYSPLGDIAATGTTSFSVSAASMVDLSTYVAGYSPRFQSSVTTRRRVFGSDNPRIENIPGGAIAASFLGLVGGSDSSGWRFVGVPGVDLSPFVQEGGAVLFAWDAGTSPINDLNRFPPKRSQKNTLWRIAGPNP